MNFKQSTLIFFGLYLLLASTTLQAQFVAGTRNNKSVI